MSEETAVQDRHEPEAAEALRKAALERAYWEAHADQLTKRYPDQFVAVRDGQVIATSPDLQELERLLAERQMGVGRTWVRFLSADPRRFIL